MNIATDNSKHQRCLARGLMVPTDASNKNRVSTWKGDLLDRALDSDRLIKGTEGAIEQPGATKRKRVKKGKRLAAVNATPASTPKVRITTDEYLPTKQSASKWTVVSLDHTFRE
jgi:hypothetical protein